VAHSTVDAFKVVSARRGDPPAGHRTGISLGAKALLLVASSVWL